MPFRNVIYDARLSDGRAIHLRISGNPVYDRAGRLQGYCGAASDVTAMVDAQNEATRHSAMLQATVESTAQGIVVFDAQFQVQIANQHALAMLGHESIDETFNALVGPELASRLRAWLALRSAADMPAVEHIGSTGGVMEVRANAMPEGGFVMTLTDMTERVKTEERLRQSEKMVALGHLVGGVAHEFNNLLTAICGFSKIALDKADQVDLVRDCLEEVILASDRATDLTRQMLAYGRKQPVETKVFSAEKILVDLKRMLQSLLPESIELSIERPEEEIFVDSDVTQITQAVLNLLLNARDAMPWGGRLTLELSTGTMPATGGPDIDDQKSGPCAIYRVTDTGTGIDEATMRQIFDPFFTTKEQGKGTGLGLSFVQAVVERSGGRILVESKIGKGTTFRIFLPQVLRPSSCDGGGLGGICLLRR